MKPIALTVALVGLLTGVSALGACGPDKPPLTPDLVEEIDAGPDMPAAPGSGAPAVSAAPNAPKPPG
jgi:hypothetical protein